MELGTLPYQKFIDAGYFKIGQISKHGKFFQVSLITPKGQAYLAKRHQQYIGSNQAMRTINIESEAIA